MICEAEVGCCIGPRWDHLLLCLELFSQSPQKPQTPSQLNSKSSFMLGTNSVWRASPDRCNRTAEEEEDVFVVRVGAAYREDRHTYHKHAAFTHPDVVSTVMTILLAHAVNSILNAETDRARLACPSCESAHAETANAESLLFSTASLPFSAG